MNPFKKFNNNSFDRKYIQLENLEFTDIFHCTCTLLGHNHTTGSDELQKIIDTIKFNNRIVGVFPYDMMPTLQIGQSCIINTDNHNQPGQHWVAIYRYDELSYLFFDSYGRVCENVIPKLKKQLGNANIISTKHVRQSGYIQSFCGQMSLSWLIYLYSQPIHTMALVI